MLYKSQTKYPNKQRKAAIPCMQQRIFMYLQTPH